MSYPTLRHCLVVVLCGLGIFTGCTKYHQARAVVEYVNQDIIGIAQLEQQAAQHYAAVVGKNYTSMDAVHHALKVEVIPTYKRYLGLLRKIDPSSDELRRLHAHCLSGAERIYDGYKTKMIGLELDKAELIRAGNLKLEQGYAEARKWQEGLLVLFDKYGVVQQKRTPDATGQGFIGLKSFRDKVLEWLTYQ